MFDDRPLTRWGAVLAGLAAAAPTLVLAGMQPELIVDDWGFAAKARFGGWSGFFPEAPARPLQEVWHAAEFLLLGDDPVPHLLVLAACNAVAGALVWLVARRFLDGRLALLIAAAWVALANRGSTRLWPSTAPNVVALVLVLSGLLLATGRRSTARLAAALTCCLLALLFYEGVGGLAAIVGLVAVVHHGRSHPRIGVVAGSAFAGASAGVLAWMVTQSPKAGDAAPFRNASRLVSIHAGAAVWPSALLVLGFGVILVVAWALATLVLPSFPARTEERLALAGVAVLMAGAAPFVVTGFPQTTDGIFDRGNLYADLGTAMVMAAALAMLWRLPGRAAPIAAALVLVALASQNAVDVRAFRDAARDGRRFLASVDRLPREQRERGPLVFPPLPNRHGVSMLVEDYDTSAALGLRYSTGYPLPNARMALTDEEFSRQRNR